LDALARAPREEYMEAKELLTMTGLEAGRINDAMALLVESGYAEWIQELGTAPFEFSEATITPRGRYEYQRVTEATGLNQQEQPGERYQRPMEDRVPARPPAPVGSPYGFTDEDWEIVAERKSQADHLYVILGYQFVSKYYDTDILQANVKSMFEEAVSLYNTRNLGQPISLQFNSLAAGYGEHLFNEISRDIISADIAVFEASDLNPNVMIEMGVALTWGVRVLPVKAEGQPRPPSDISGHTWADYMNSAGKFIDPDHQTKKRGQVSV
jgi:hypothetical protein